MRTALTIAGSDCSGGAGIQADIKTMMANGVYAMSAVTALTAQNTTGVSVIRCTDPECLEAQLDQVFTDIFPDAVKIGMVADTELIRSIAKKLKEYQPRYIVLDPVMVSTSGAELLKEDAADALTRELFPLATVLTPNLPETEALTGQKITKEEEMCLAAASLVRRYGCAVLCKGGHSSRGASDLLARNPADPEFTWFAGRRIENPNTHGTGCTLSSAIAANLAKGFSLTASVQRAKEYVSEALAAMLDLGNGSGPLNHGFAVHGYYAEDPDQTAAGRQGAEETKGCHETAAQNF